MDSCRVFLSQIADDSLPNLIVNSSQQTSANKPRDFIPVKMSGAGNAPKLQVAPNPYSRPTSDFQQIPPVDSNSCRTSDRIVPVFASKIRTAFPRGLTDAKPAVEDQLKPQPAPTNSTTTLRPGSVIKPTFTQAIKPCAPAKTSAKLPTSKVIGVAQRNAINTPSFKPKLLTDNTAKSASTFQGLDTSRRMAPNCVTNLQFPTTTANRNGIIRESNVQSPAYQAHSAVSVPHIQQAKTTTKFPVSSSGQSLSTSSTFSVCGPVDLTMECSGRYQPVCLNPHVREEYSKTANKIIQDRAECQKRKLEVCFAFLLVAYNFSVLLSRLTGCLQLLEILEITGI